MPEAPVTPEDHAVDVTPAAPWRVAAVTVQEHGVLQVRFQDGVEGRVVIRPSFMYGVFEPLRDPALFARADVVRGAVTWPGELDLAPDALYDAVVAHGECVVS